jgi:pantoate--beta-alanine ligase
VINNGANILKKRLKVVVFLNIKILLPLFTLQIQPLVQVIYTPSQWIPIRNLSLKNDKTIGFVPTMGALHEGHLELIKRCKLESDISVVSIFVNPTQFNNPSDFEKYPITLESDLQKCEEAGVDFVFVPTVTTIYPQKLSTTFNFGEIEQILEGKFRPGHFNGVGIVVSKLFNIIQPQKAFFGQKDLQQVAVIKRLIQDLSFQIELITVPTKRETDGLAMSSRNIRLSSQERIQALILYRSLIQAKTQLLAGIPWINIYPQIKQDFDLAENVILEYFDLVEPTSFTKLTDFEPKQPTAICVAAYLGAVRLIDNITVIS